MLQRQKITLETPGMVLFDPATLAAFIAERQIKATDLLQYFNDFPQRDDAAIAQGCLLQMLEAAATSIELIESQILNATGEFAGLFVQESQREFTNIISARVPQRRTARGRGKVNKPTFLSWP